MLHNAIRDKVADRIRLRRVNALKSNADDLVFLVNDWTSTIAVIDLDAGRVNERRLYVRKRAGGQ